MEEYYNHYSMNIRWSDEDEAYIVTVPELPGCRTHGETLEEAIHQGQDAIDSWIDAGLAWGRRIPEPRVLRRRNRDLVSKAS
jgi:predicted RNase H-like HicB family nuclease